MRGAKQRLIGGLKTAAPLLILLVGVLLFLYLGRQRRIQARPAEQEVLPSVRTVVVRPHKGPLDIEVDGVVVPYRQITLSAQVDGKIIFKSPDCRAGRFVSRGTLLLQIDPQDYQLQVQRLQQELRQAEAALQELDTQIGNTQALLQLALEQQQLQHRELERQQQLHQRRVISDSELDQTRQATIQIDNTVVTLQNQLRYLQAQRERLVAARDHAAVLLDEAKLRLARTEIRCPEDTDAVIASEQVEQGDFVRIGTPLVTLEDTSRVEVRCHLRVDQLCWLWSQQHPAVDPQKIPIDLAYQVPKTPATVIFEVDGLRYGWKGVLWRYESSGLNELTRTVPCRVLVDDPRDVRLLSVEGNLPRTGPKALVRGMFVTVQLHATPGVQLLRVPEAAIQPGDWLWKFVPDADEQRAARGRLQQIPVRVADIVEQQSFEVEWNGTRRVIDGKVVRVEDGKVWLLEKGGKKVLLDAGPIQVVHQGRLVPVGTQGYQIVDGRLVRATPDSDEEFLGPQVLLPLAGKVKRRVLREAVVYVPADVLKPGDRVVVTPIAGYNGMPVQEIR